MLLVYAKQQFTEVLFGTCSELQSELYLVVLARGLFCSPSFTTFTGL